jgi:membrane-associated phospholipid phosphatase
MHKVSLASARRYSRASRSLCTRRIAPLVLIALLITVTTELCRVYLGLHYPSDILGSFLLAAMIYWLVEATAFFGFDHVVIGWERSSPATFYSVAFAGCHGLATGFEDLRNFLLLLPR